MQPSSRFANWSFTPVHPALLRCEVFQLGWIAQIFVSNQVLMILVAGELYLYRYVFRQQCDELATARSFAENNRVFTFNHQVLDNMFWTYEVLMMWATGQRLHTDVANDGSPESQQHFLRKRKQKAQAPVAE